MTRDSVVAVAEILSRRHNTARTGVVHFYAEAEEVVVAVVESIAAGFDTAAKDAAVHNKGPDRDIDVVLAWECAARWIRDYAGNRPGASQGASTDPGGTPASPGPVEVTYGSTYAPGVSPECQQSAAEVHEACDGCLCPCHPCAACGCDSRWHDGPSGRCAGDFMACDCPAYVSATSPTGDPTP